MHLCTFSHFEEAIDMNSFKYPINIRMLLLLPIHLKSFLFFRENAEKKDFFGSQRELYIGGSCLKHISHQFGASLPQH